jgi:hypothetical protein
MSTSIIKEVQVNSGYEYAKDKVFSQFGRVLISSDSRRSVEYFTSIVGEDGKVISFRGITGISFEHRFGTREEFINRKR